MKDTKNSVVVVIQKKDNSNLFLTYISPSHKIFANRYRLAGGKLKEGEDFEFAAIRELKEEYGINLFNVQLHYQKPNVLGGIIYFCSAEYQGNPVVKVSDVDEVKWRTIDQIFESNMVPNCKIAVCAYLWDNNPSAIKSSINVLNKDKEFIDVIFNQAFDLYEKILNL